MLKEIFHDSFDNYFEITRVMENHKHDWMAIRTSQIGSVERRTFTFEQQSAQLDFIIQENEFLMWYDTIIIIKVHQKLSNLFQGTHSQTFNKFKKSLWPSPLLKLKACFSHQVDVGPPQPVAAKVIIL